MARDKAYREAEERIRKARRTRAKELDLSDMGLGWLPGALGELAELRDLDLSNNCLSVLPESLLQLNQLEWLDLSRNPLASSDESRHLDRDSWLMRTLPDRRPTLLSQFLNRLTDLRELHLSGSQLTILPEFLGRLERLQKLELSNNRLSRLPESLGQLTQLRDLRLHNNQLTSLPESLGKLAQLQVLYLGDNQLTSLPESICELARLRELYLFNNRLTNLPKALGQLRRLRVVKFSRNRLTTLPESLGQLTELRQLWLDGNQLTSLPESLGRLERLQALSLEDNVLTALPQSMRDLANLDGLSLYGNPGLGVPDEVFGLTGTRGDIVHYSPKPPREILDYYFSTRGREGEPLGELRLIVVGRPKAGKTSLIKRLLREPMDPLEPETHGINIRDLPLECSESTLQRASSLRARVWDFGGQHVLHAMHEFFLRRRCLYLLVVEQRVNDIERDLTYWLQLIRSYAGDAPVVVALNQSKGIARSFARAALERDYGPILAWVPTECASEDEVPGATATIEAVRAALTSAAAGMPEPKKLFPVKWRKIKDWLEGMKEPYLDYAVFAQRCAELHEDDPKQQEALAAVMDELGVALNYARDPRLRDTTVLRPNWLANGIYALLRANMLRPEGPLAPGGVLTEEKVGEILAAAEQAGMLEAAEYPREKWPFLLRLMGLFQLSFPLDEEGRSHLVPTLLYADEPPESEEPAGEGVVRLRYEFDVVPGPLIGRFLVRLFPLIEGRKAWQRGARLRYASARARVWQDLSEKYVYATVAGGEHDRGELLSMIRETLKDLFREYDRLRVVEQWWHDGDWVPRGTLEKFKVLPPDEEEREDALFEREEVWGERGNALPERGEAAQ